MTKDSLIRTVLVSVTDKSGLIPFLEGMIGIIPSLKIIASGGTAKALDEFGVSYTPLQHYTGFPECFGGRVKTLHPKVMGGILLRRGQDEQEAQQLSIEPIDLVVCNLYDFEKASRIADIPLPQLMEHLDIGGSSLIRSASKNFFHVGIAVDPQDYPRILQDMRINKGQLSLDTRKNLAAKALRLSAQYEAVVAGELAKHIGEDLPPSLNLSSGKSLRYGENPDQKGWLYENPEEQGVVQSHALSGKELSYNNYEDATVAFEAVHALDPILPLHAISIVKHGNLCSLATGASLSECFQRSWDGDSKSAFGSVIGFKKPVTSELIPLLRSKFIEVMIAPDFDHTFIEWAKTHRASMRLLKQDKKVTNAGIAYKTISGGVLAQTKKKQVIPADLKVLLTPCNAAAARKVGVVTNRQPSSKQLSLFAFGIIAVNFAKSNAICIVREYAHDSYQLLAVGAGQPNRVDSLCRLAIPKAIENLKAEHQDDPLYDPKSDLEKCVLVSDGFFPFDDSIIESAKCGIKTCIQPGGSVNDQTVIETANQQGMCMLFTGERYFYH